MSTRSSVILVAFSTSVVAGCGIDTSAATDADSTDADAESSDFDAILARHTDEHNRLPNRVPMFDAAGMFTTVSAHGFIDLDNEFFQDLGSNGRRCVSCHVPTRAGRPPKLLNAVFDQSDGGKFQAQRESMVAFETSLATAQISDRKTRNLHDDGANGGPSEI